jgi:hypothetical protein
LKTFSWRSDDLFGAATVCQWCLGLIVARTHKRVAGGMLTFFHRDLKISRPAWVVAVDPVIKPATLKQLPFANFFRILLVLDWGVALC